MTEDLMLPTTETPQSDRRIRVLSADVVNQIAAGEVVERPASVVKELLENALDAGARRVDVEIEQGGLRRIRVVDDGCGMSSEELRLCIVRHATSKLQNVEDLWRIRTMGFRGEALPSIAAVGKLSLRSRPGQREIGHSLRLEAGALLGEEPAGCPVGTIVEVMDLFFNTPARLKFLKSRATETAHITDAVSRLALGAPGVHLTLTVEGRRTLDLPACANRLERARSVLGRRAAALVVAAIEEPGLRVEVCLAPPLQAGRSAQSVNLLVNRRFVRDRALVHAAAAGCGEQIAPGRYPVAAIYLDLDPDRLDVNVHPQKVEVRFLEPERAYAVVRRCVREALSTGALSEPPAERSYTLGSGGARPAAGYEEQKRRLLEATRRFWSARSDGSAANESLAFYSAAELQRAGSNPESGYYGRLQVIGQAMGTYLVCEGDGELVLIDQHAAHERINFEKLRLQAASGALPSQRLLIPVPMTLEPHLLACACEASDTLGELGFELEPFGGDTVTLRAVPELLAGADPNQLVRDVLEDLASFGSSERVTARREQLLARLACHSSVRAGRALETHEIHALLCSLDQVDFAQSCPHGRPVAVHLDRAELERRFGRS